MIRQQRPMGLTLLLSSIQSKQQLDDKAIYQLINYSLNHSLQYNNKPFTIETLSELLGISKAQAYKYYLQHSSKMASLINPNEVEGLYRGQIFSILAGSHETLSQIRNQRRILQGAQGHEYVPFLSGEVGQILSTEMAAFEKMAKIAQGLLAGTDPRALPHNPNEASPTNEKAIGINEAIKLLESKGQLGLTYDSNHHAPLREKYLLDEGKVQVIANQQQGNTDDEALVKMNKHRSRRADSYQIDEEEL